jgi:ATP-dependent RNA helicase DeaD
VLRAEEPEQAIIFCRTKIGTSRLDKALRAKGMRSKALHGDLSQGQRDGVMLAFKGRSLPLLVATDVAARGLDIEHVTHVINYDVPTTTEPYVHRIGRTGRVGRTGRAITFVTPAQREEIERIEREAKTSIGEWEPPEERIEHAPRPRRRDHAQEDRPRRDREKLVTEGASPNGAGGGDGDHAKLFINRGRRSGIEDEDIRWALVEGAVVPDEAIGEIRVMERFSFVDLEAEHAEKALERLDGTKLKGKQVRVEYAKG